MHTKNYYNSNMDPKNSAYNSIESKSNTHSENSVWELSSNDDSVLSDCESFISGSKNRALFQNQNQLQNRVLGNEFITLGEDDVVHNLIKTRFIKGLGNLGAKTEVVGIRRNGCFGVLAQAKVQCFQVCERAVARLRGGNANVKYAWFGTSGELDIRDIVSYGFDHRHGNKLCFSPDDSPLQSAKRCVAGKDGVRHLLLCRVILGRSEVVHPCNKDQYNPSSEEYDSGIDNLSNPNKFIIWSSRMNTHVLPAYVISFKVDEKKEEKEAIRPSSPWMPFPTLISVLSKVLPSPDVALISMFYKYHKNKKISRHELIQKVRVIAGDKLLISAIKSYRANKKKDGNFIVRRSKNGSLTANKLPENGMITFL